MRIGLVGSLAYLGIYSRLTHVLSGHAIALSLPEDQTSSDTSYTTHTDKCRRAERTLPLASDVVGLVRHDGGHIAIRSSGSQENAWTALARFLRHDADQWKSSSLKIRRLSTWFYMLDRMPLTEVSDTWARVETHDRDTDDAQDHVEHDDGTSKMVLVTSPAGRVHHDCG